MSKLYLAKGRSFYEDTSKLSLSKGGILNSTNGGNGWAVTGSKAVGTDATGTLTITDANSFLPTEGALYKVTFDISGYTSGTVSPIFGGAVHGTTVSGNGTGYEFLIHADATLAASKIHGLEGYAFTGSVDNLSFKKVSVATLSELGASVTLPHKLIQVPVVQAVYAPSIQLDLKLVVAQDPQVDFAGTMTLAHTLTDATLAELSALIHEVALSLGIKLEQAQATSVAYQVAATLAHELGQTEIGANVVEVAITFLQKFSELDESQWITEGTATFAHQLNASENAGWDTNAATDLALQLDQAQATSVAYQVLATLSHELGQAEIGANVIEAAVTFLQQLLELEETQWTADAVASLALNLGLNQNIGATILVAITLGTRQFGPQGAITGTELNPDLGFDTPADWETGVV